MIDLINRMLSPLRNRIANMVGRAVLQLVDDSKKMQLLQVGLLAEESREAVERFQNYGFTSVPLAGAEGVLVFVGGRRDHGLAIAVDDRRYRKKNLESGEVAMYTDEGDFFIIKRGGIVDLTAATSVDVNTAAATVTASDTFDVDTATATIAASTKTVVDSPLVELAGNTEAAVKGTTYLAAEATFATALATFTTAIGALNTALVVPTGILAPDKATFATAVTTFGTAVGTFGSAVGAAGSTKVKLS
jgi:phage baseplate assembly protein V